MVIKLSRIFKLSDLKTFIKHKNLLFFLYGLINELCRRKLRGNEKIGFESPFICPSNAHPRTATWHQLGFREVNGEVIFERRTLTRIGLFAFFGSGFAHIFGVKSLTDTNLVASRHL